MSFSYELKKELSQVIDAPRHCRVAELAAIVLLLGTAEKTEKSFRIRLEAGNRLVLQTAAVLLKKLFSAECETEEKTSGGAKYRLEIEEAYCEDVLTTIKAVPGPDGSIEPDTGKLLWKNCCKRAFLRGAFLSAGTVSDPDRSYHMEIRCRTEEQAGFLDELIRSLEISSRVIRRKRYWSVYVKDSSRISDMFGLMGARIALLELENRRILHSMRGDVNRKVNCETANIGKTAAASARQIEDIEYLISSGAMARLTGELAEAARLRLEYPEATLQELAGMMDPPVSRSGINHRLRKLTRLAAEQRAAGK